MESKIDQKLSNKAYAFSTVWLVFFQVLGLVIPILTLPVLARGLGVQVFGQVMLAQAVVFLAVLFVDAGFNVESQRRASVAKDPLELQQALVDNFIARSICCLPVILIVLLFGYLMPNLPFLLVLVSLLLVCGTLLFPQWWYVAQHAGIKMGLVATFGRLLSAAGVLFFVHIPADATAAALVASCATLLSGLMLLPHWWQSFRPYVRLINWMGWKSYINDVKHTIFSGFFASASSLVPVLVLGVFTGPFQTGLFTAADRLTRAGAFLLSFIEQSLMGWFVKNTQNGQSESLHIRRQVLLVLSGLLMVGCGIAALMSPLVLEFLYGQAFVGSIGILQILLCWLMVHGIRKAVLAFYWSAVGDLKTVAMFQWSEAILVSLLAIIGAVWQGGLGVAICLCISEALLLVIMVSYLFRSDR